MAVPGASDRGHHSASRQAIIVRTSSGKSATANAVVVTPSPSSHMVTKRTATTAAHREVTRANMTLTPRTPAVPGRGPARGGGEGHPYAGGAQGCDQGEYDAHAAPPGLLR